ncbi:hypothetical protein CEE69_00550 [Rhodopirellula bahusiensis]|uniref:Uncharacterized protein n=1 Tax=Rhodopirellula bahusiensis TaxID=2014065 RepID=A0A2G1WD30_9BACT|nr:hypothetical protein CEE69_00550 [Rhodopirellula bahusiensis]
MRVRPGYHLAPSQCFGTKRGVQDCGTAVPAVIRGCAAFRRICTRRTSPETKFGESGAVQAYARVRAEHGKRLALPSPEFSLNARIPTLPNCVQEGDFNLASTALENCTTSFLMGDHRATGCLTADQPSAGKRPASMTGKSLCNP